MFGDRRVHDRRGGVAVFVAEIGADELAAWLAEGGGVEVDLSRDLVEARLEYAPRLPVAGLEIDQHLGQLLGDLRFGEFDHGVDQSLAA